MSAPRLNVQTIGPLSLFIVLAGWAMAALAVSVLTPEIPIHFFADGYMDRTGPRAPLWILPIGLTLAYVLLTAIQFIPPDRLNVPVAVTDDNRDRVYALARALSRAVRIGALATLLCLEWAVIHSVGNGAVDRQFYLAALVPMLASFVWLGSYVARMTRA
jgi:hypothetical protein